MKNSRYALLFSTKTQVFLQNFVTVLPRKSKICSVMFRRSEPISEFMSTERIVAEFLIGNSL